MQTIQSLFEWWYWCYPTVPSSLYFCCILGALGFIGIFILGSWKGKINKGDGFVGNTFQLLVISSVGSFMVWAAFPLIITMGTLYLINIFLSKWGENCRELAQTKEKRREETLQAMLDSDPIFMQKYKELMNSTPKI